MEIGSPVRPVRINRTDVDMFAGQTIEEANDQAETGYIHVGVAHDGDFLPEETTRDRDDDTVLVTYTDRMILAFEVETQ